VVTFSEAVVLVFDVTFVDDCVVVVFNGVVVEDTFSSGATFLDSEVFSVIVSVEVISAFVEVISASVETLDSLGAIVVVSSS